MDCTERALQRRGNELSWAGLTEAELGLAGLSGRRGSVSAGIDQTSTPDPANHGQARGWETDWSSHHTCLTSE